MKPTLEVVVGGQFGSEAKGHVVKRLTERALDEHDQTYVHVVRVAGPNAGHTGYSRDGQAWPLRQIPVAAVLGSDRVFCYIAAGSEIDPPVLFDEYDRLTKANLQPELVVHTSATLITDDHKMDEGAADLTQRIGSTGKGIGAARADRIMRIATVAGSDAKFLAECAKRRIVVSATAGYPRESIFGADHYIVEGTQGYGLGLHTRYYPQVTSSDCRAADFMAMAGYHAWEFSDVNVWVVARVYPIRVAGNSGPLKNEVSWEELGLPEERTTVTKKVRRVGGEDWSLVREAVVANGRAPVVHVALTMLDQKFPALRDKHFNTDLPLKDWDEAQHYLTKVARMVGADIDLVTTGPNTGTFL
jgi:adenylosuccinate synthase